MSIKPKVKVGDIVWALPPSYRGGDNRGLQEQIVSRVGREYFYIHEKGYPNTVTKIGIGDMASYVGTNDNGAYRTRVYLHPDEYEKDVADAKEYGFMMSFFRQYNVHRLLSPDQIRRINAIVSEPKAKTP